MPLKISSASDLTKPPIILKLELDMEKASLFCPKCSRFYPDLEIKKITRPNRFYAFPILGLLIKLIILIPQGIILLGMGILEIFVALINSLIVLFSGQYWPVALKFNKAFITMIVKLSLFAYGLTDKYPGFNFNTEGFKLDIPEPKKPNRYFAIPIFGGLARMILLIPYFIYEQVIGNAGKFGAVISFAPVLFQGFYPESTYEMVRDAVRVNQASTVYFFGLSDTYPSFYISLNHSKMKIFLILVGVLLSFGSRFTYQQPANQLPKPQLPSPFKTVSLSQPSVINYTV